MLNLLAQTPGLRVTGRTSSFFYKDKNENLTDIGRALNVDNILEGSVRKSGVKVRITAQLVSASDGFHLWSKTYDREITDIFVVQDEIAAEVARAMQLTLLADGITVTDRTTSNPEAHDLYLRAKSELYKRRIDTIRRSIDLYKQAIVLNPEFGPPLVEYATALNIIYNNHSVGSYEEMVELAQEALKKAENLGYTNSDYYASLGLLYNKMARVDPNYISKSVEALEKAIELNPKNVNAYMWPATTVDQQTLDPNRFVRAEQLNRKAIELDPEYPAYYQVLTSLYLNQAKLDEAARSLSNIPSTVMAKPFSLMQILASYDDKLHFVEYVDDIPLDNPGYAISQSVETAILATDAELIAEAEVLLLRADPDFWAQGVINRLMLNSEFELAQKLLENAIPEFAAQGDQSQSVTLDGVLNYMVAIYFQGETDRAGRLAHRMLEAVEPLGYQFKGIVEAYCYLVLNQLNKAIDNFVAAADAGWLGYYQNDVDKDPLFQSLIKDPRIISVRQQMDIKLDALRPALRKALQEQGIATSI